MVRLLATTMITRRATTRRAMRGGVTMSPLSEDELDPATSEPLGSSPCCARHSIASPTTAVAPSTCRIRTVSPIANASPSCWLRALHSSAPSLIRPLCRSTACVTRAVRPTTTSTPSSCSGVPASRCFFAIGRTTRSSARETTTKPTSCRATAPPSSATAMPPTAPPANISSTKSTLASSPAANRPAAISQSSHGSTPPSFSPREPSRGGVVTWPLVHDFPAGRFAVWATAWLAGRCSYDEALDALLGSTAHRVAGLPRTDGAVPLGWALTALRGLGETRFRLVLPVPGDLRWLPRVPGLAPLALESGQSAVGRRLALVPEALGPEVVQWTVFPLAGAPPVAPLPEGNLRAVSGALDLAVGDTARALGVLDAARGTPEGPARLAGLARGTGARGLPADHDHLALSVLGRAERLAKVLDLAMADAPGAAVNHAQAAARDDALRPLAHAVREATVAGFNWVPRG